MRFGPVEHLFRTLRFQLTFWNTIAILVLVSAALWGVREGLRWTLLTELDKAMAEDVKEVGLIIEGYYPDWDQIGRELKPKVISHSQRGWYVRVSRPKAICCGPARVRPSCICLWSRRSSTGRSTGASIACFSTPCQRRARCRPWWCAWARPAMRSMRTFGA